MPKLLTLAQVDHCKRHDFASPAPVLTANEVRKLRAALEYWEKRQGHPRDCREKSKSYLLYKWADMLDGASFILDPLEHVTARASATALKARPALPCC